jgi:hypothetical protein
MNRLLPVALLACAFWGCNKTEQIPDYVRVEPFVVDEPGGAAEHAFSEGWFFAGTNFLGAYTLPGDIPVLAEGSQEILVFPGVKENGITLTPNIYPMMQWHIETKTLTPGSSTTVTPRVSYLPEVSFAWSPARGSFDSISSVVLENRDNDPTYNFVISNIDGFSGKYMEMKADTAHPIMEVLFEAAKNLPTVQERQTWLEIHYQNELPLQLFLLGQTPGVDDEFIQVFLFNPSAEWNKLYLNLTEYLVFRPHESYRLLLRLNISDQTSLVSGKARVDNVRIVHF